MPEAKCRIVTGKVPGSDEDEMCGKEATVFWPIMDDSDTTVLDIIMACPEHDQKYEEHHTLIAKDLRGFVHMFQLPLETESPPEVQLSQQ